MKTGLNINSQLTSQVKESREGIGNNLLGQLGDRVKSALDAKNLGGSPELKIDPQDVKNMIAQISTGNIPGMQQNMVV
ncbi:MAG: hypothetical protein U9R38_02400 [Candidatus Margulisiibacteriota bacterium]|nr:hypothetical protein [Candidatus Margulisiibacteriota bacterium]